MYEYYSDNHTRLYLTQHSGSGGGCHYTPPFDPAAGMHVYGMDIEPTGSDWYVDGVKVCHATGTSSGMTNIIDDNFVYSGNGNSELAARRREHGHEVDRLHQSLATVRYMRHA